MGVIKLKVKSQRGASITFALLLFLVCAMVSSVVIVTATAASGRLAKIAETDQRYYAVNSAAELLRNEINDKTIKVIETRKLTTENTYNTTTDVTPEKTERKIEVVTKLYNSTDAGTPISTGSFGPNAVNPEEGETIEEAVKKTIKEIVYLTMPSDVSLAMEAACKVMGINTSAPIAYPKEQILAVENKEGTNVLTADDITILQVDLVEMLDDAGTLKIYASKDARETSSDGTMLNHTLLLTFMPEITTVEDVHTDNGALEEKAGKYVQTITETTTTTTTVEWELVSISRSVKPTPTVTPEDGHEG